MNNAHKTAFQRAAEFLIDDAMKSLVDPEHSPFKPPPSRFYVVEALENHIRHIDAGIGGVRQNISKGQILEVTDLSIHSLDMSKFILLKELIK